MRRDVGYLPIEDHGIIGDLHTAALVGADGTIDWLCLPRFDSPSVFCSILDDRKGGHFRLRPLSYARSQQLYLPDTNVLLTRFLSLRGHLVASIGKPANRTRFRCATSVGML